MAPPALGRRSQILPKDDRLCVADPVPSLASSSPSFLTAPNMSPSFGVQRPHNDPFCLSVYVQTSPSAWIADVQASSHIPLIHFSFQQPGVVSSGSSPADVSGDSLDGQGTESLVGPCRKVRDCRLVFAPLNE